MDQELRWRLAPDWSELTRIRREIAALLSAYPRELRNATAMTGAELLENAIKYGRCGPDAPAIEISLRMRQDWLRVEVANHAADRTVLSRLVKRIRELSNAADRASFCIERLEASVHAPYSRGDRGLYRIGCEGRFDLDCTVVDDLVTVVATRRIE